MSGDAARPPTVGERRWVNGALGGFAWITALIFFFPVLWMVINSFKSEHDANTSPEARLRPDPRPLSTR